MLVSAKEMLEKIKNVKNEEEKEIIEKAIEDIVRKVR